MNILIQAQFAIYAIAPAVLVLEKQIQTVSPVYILYYSSTKHALLLVQMDIFNQAHFAINAIAPAVLVLEEQM